MAIDWIAVLVAVALQVVAYAITPKPSRQKPAEAQDLDSPTTETGQPIIKTWGTVTVKGLTILHFSDKTKKTMEIKA